MNYKIFLSMLCGVFALQISTAQDNTTNNNYYDDYQSSDARWSLIGYGGVGYAIVDNDNQPNYNMNASTFDFLLDYRIGNRWGISTGVGFNQLSGTGFDNTGQNFYHERGTLRIPLLLSGNYNIAPKVRLVANLGFYAKTILKDDYSTVNNATIGDIYEGWNFGFQSGIGLSYNFNQKFSMGILFNTQSDFNRVESTINTGSAINDRQKIRSINTVGLLFTYHW